MKPLNPNWDTIEFEELKPDEVISSEKPTPTDVDGQDPYNTSTRLKPIKDIWIGRH